MQQTIPVNEHQQRMQRLLQLNWAIHAEDDRDLLRRGREENSRLRSDKSAMAEEPTSDDMGDIVLGDQVRNYVAPETTTTTTQPTPQKKSSTLLKTLGIAALSAAVPGAAAIGYYLANRNQPDPQSIVVPAWEIGLKTDSEASRE